MSTTDHTRLAVLVSAPTAWDQKWGEADKASTEDLPALPLTFGLKKWEVKPSTRSFKLLVFLL